MFPALDIVDICQVKDALVVTDVSTYECYMEAATSNEFLDEKMVADEEH